MFEERDKHYPSGSGLTILATAVINITKPVTKNYFEPSNTLVLSGWESKGCHSKNQEHSIQFKDDKIKTGQWAFWKKVLNRELPGSYQHQAKDEQCAVNSVHFCWGVKRNWGNGARSTRTTRRKGGRRWHAVFQDLFGTEIYMSNRRWGGR